jgi:hypothetical protein
MFFLVAASTTTTLYQAGDKSAITAATVKKLYKRRLFMSEARDNSCTFTSTTDSFKNNQA